jgi:hypothetical protein
MVQPPPGLVTDVERERIGNAIRDTCSASLMSDTKWRKLVRALNTVPSVDHYFLKTIRATAEEVGFGFLGLWAPHAYIDTFSFGPLYLREIEWMEFPSFVPIRENGPTPPSGHYQDLDGLRRALDAIGKFPLEETPRGLRVVGHKCVARRA